MTDHPSGEAAAAALEEAQELLDRDGVEGVGQGATEDGVPCILVLTAGLIDTDTLPATISGVPVRVLDIGEPPTAQDHDANQGIVTDGDEEPDRS